MKTILLTLCTIQGIVDSKTDGTILFEVRPAISNDDIVFMSVSNELLPPAIKEGDKINLTILANEDLERYCH